MDLDSLNQIIDNGDEDINTYYFRSKVLYDLESYDQALSDIEYCIENTVGVVEYHFHNGLVLEELGRFPEAMDAYENCLKRNKNHCKTLTNLGTIRLLVYNDHKGALKYLNKCIKIEPNNEVALTNRANVYLELGQLDKAQTDINLLLELNPNDVNTIILNGYLHEDLNRVDDAITEYKRAISIDSNNVAGFVSLANCYSSNAQIEEGVECLSTYLDIQPNSIEARIARARLNAERERFRAALRDIDYCLGIVSNDIELWVLKGDYEYISEKYGESVKAYTNAISLDENLDQKELYLFRGLAYKKADEKENACMDFKIATDIITSPELLDELVNYCKD